MQILKTAGWDEYELIDSGDGKRLERFGKYVLVRPDPEAIWKKQNADEWVKADAVFVDEKGNPHWERASQMSESWLVKYNNLMFQARLTPFKHTGIFPEQQVNWEWMENKILNFKFKISNSGCRVSCRSASRTSLQSKI